MKTRRLFYFGHVARISNDRFPHILLHRYTHGHRPKMRWIDNIRESRRLQRLHFMKLLDSPWSGHSGETRFALWAATARRLRHRR